MTNEEQVVWEEESRHCKDVVRSLQKEATRLEKMIRQYEEECKYKGYDYEDISRWQDSKRRLTRYKESYFELKPRIKEPYYGRLDVKTNEEDLSMYIGKADVYIDHELVVASWQSEYGSAYVMASKEKNVKIAGTDYDLDLRRELQVKNSKLYDLVTTYDAKKDVLNNVIDPFLLSVLQDKRRQARLTDIIKTIQANQNTIIRLPIFENFVVQGCAGSGKTMILLHRLSVLLYQNKDLDLSRIKIITPTNLFKEHINELSHELGIYQIQQISLDDYYKDLIGRLSGGSFRLNRTIRSESVLEEEFLKLVYGKRILNELTNAYFDFWKNSVKLLENPMCELVLNKLGVAWNVDIKTYKGYVLNGLRESLETGIGKIEKADADFKNKKYALKRKKEDRKTVGSRLKRVTKKVDALRVEVKETLSSNIAVLSGDIKMISDKMRSNEGRINACLMSIDELKAEEKKLGNRRDSEAVQSRSLIDQEVRQDMAEIDRLQNENMVLLAERQEKEKVHEQYSNVYKRFIANVWTSYSLQETGLFSTKTIDDLETLSREMKILQDMRPEVFDREIEELESGLADLERSKLTKQERALVKKLLNVVQELSFSNIVETVYFKQREKWLHGKYNSYTFRFDAFWILYLCTLYFPKLSGNVENYIHIDEAQDISEYEYTLLYDILGADCVFNLYGDVNQLIYSYKGIKEWGTLPFIEQQQIYTLNENYRNTLQITNYCNKCFNTNVMAIGLNGKDVDHRSAQNGLKWIVRMKTENPKARCAVLYHKDEDGMKKLLKDEIFTFEEQNDKISVFTVEEAKGLEFEYVVSFVNGMSSNEKYISFTRALTGLSIVKDAYEKR